jgi:quercetin dioxygenase-like cupin family protein
VTVERDAAAALAAEDLAPQRWSNGPGDTYPAHRHGYRKVLFCVSGSITFHTAEADRELLPGDRLDLPAGVEHSATVGPGGVTCLEAAIAADGPG